MATGATEFIDRTSADVYIPEVWSHGAIVARENALVYSNLVNRGYEKELSVGDVVHVPSLGNLAARTKTINTAVTYETITETNTDITVTTHDYAAIAVESIAKIQTNRDQLKLYSGKMGYALGLAVDDILAGRPDDFTNAVGVLAAENPDSDWLRARQYLNDADAPQETRYIVISPAAETGLLRLDRFVHNDYEMIHGGKSKETALEYAYVTSWYNMPVYRSVNVEGSNAAGHDNAMFQKEAIALVMQLKPKVHMHFDIDYITDKVVMEQIHGSAIMRNDHGVFVRGA